MDKKYVLLLILGLLFLSGCILEYREGLPAVITIKEIPPPVSEEIVCESPPCATIVQMGQIKRTEYVCSPYIKEDNNDPRGITYETQKGDLCEPLEKPTTVCLHYDCNFNKENDIGYYEIETKFTKKKEDTIYVYGVMPASESFTATSTATSTGNYKSNPDIPDSPVFEFIYSSYNNYKYKGVYALRPFITLEQSEQKKDWTSQLMFPDTKDCPAKMPIKYPYNSIDFAYNPIKTGNVFIRDLSKDYIHLKEEGLSFIKEQESATEAEEREKNPCEEICSPTEEDIKLGISLSATQQKECDECNQKQKKKIKDMVKEQKKKAKEEAKKSNSNKGGYTLEELEVQDDGLSMCTGFTPCVEIDRSRVQNENGDIEMERYFICRCMCDVTFYANYVCTRAGDDTEYFYNACEVKNTISDQGGYIFSVHGFEAELFKNILGHSENKMLAFMIGQGPTFDEYTLAREYCKPEISADLMVEAGNKRISPDKIEVFSGAPICFKNDGTKTRDIYIGSDKMFLTNISSDESICFDTGPDTNFTIGTTTILIDDKTKDKFKATVTVIQPEESSNIQNTIKFNDDEEELKFFYNDDIELSLLYASAPFSSNFDVIFEGNVERDYVAYDTGEYFYFYRDKEYKEHYNTWISYEVGEDSMKLYEHDYNYLFEKESSSFFERGGDINLDNEINVLDYIKFHNMFQEMPILKDGKTIMIKTIPPFYSDGLNKLKNLPYFIGLSSSSETKFDYPMIIKGKNYFEFDPGAITLPLNSKFCIHNTINKKVDLILEKKISPKYSREELYNREVTESENMAVDSSYFRFNNIFESVYSNYHPIYYSYIIRSLNDISTIFLNSLDITNKNYEFVEGKSLFQGMECCFTLSEPGVYRVSSLTGETGTGYVVVFPDNIGNTFTLKDYEYDPEISVPVEGDFICFNNPFDFDRTLSYKGTSFGTINLPKHAQVCSYDWAKKINNNYNFTDEVTGGTFEIKTVNGTVLNIDVYNSQMTQLRGNIKQHGSVCFINKDDMETIIYYSNLNVPGTINNITLRGNGIECIPFENKGLYKITGEQVEESLVTAVNPFFYLTVGDDNEGYIYNGTFYHSPVTFELEKFEDFMSIEVTVKSPSEIEINNLDDEVYYLYSLISFNNKHNGFSSSTYYLPTRDIIFENKGNETIKFMIYNSDETIHEFNLAPSKYVLKKYQDGDYKVEVQGDFSPSGDSVTDKLNKIKTETKIYIDRIIINKDVTYFSDDVSVVHGSESINFSERLFFNASTSMTQNVYYGTYLKPDTSVGDNPIKNYFVIDSTVDSQSLQKMQTLSGLYKNIDFGVHVLNTVPTTDLVFKAKQMLAYDRTLPIFTYSRIGKIDIILDNPYKTEVHNIPKGAEVSYVISSWIEGSGISRATVSSSSSVKYGRDNVNILTDRITFTIKPTEGSKFKKVIVNPVETSKTIVMDYTPFSQKPENINSFLYPGPNKYIIHNYAYEPRAFTLRPTDSKNELCVYFDEPTKNSPKRIDLSDSPFNSASYLMLYDIKCSNIYDFNLNVFHDELLKSFCAPTISEILALSNYGIEDTDIILARTETGGDEIGELYLKPSTDNNLDFNLVSGYISGLTDIRMVRAYRLYGDSSKFKLNVDDSVYTPPKEAEENVDNYSILAQVYTHKKPTIETLLSVTNTYIRMKDKKALPNKWYMAGLANTVFPNLIQGIDTYPEELSLPQGKMVGTEAEWYPTGCGDYLLVVPFNNTMIPLTFAFDVPYTNTSVRDGISGDYIRTLNKSYPLSLYRVNQTVSTKQIQLYNGEIINDIRILMSENPNEADEICGFFDVGESFEFIDDFANHYEKKDRKTVNYFKTLMDGLNSPCIGGTNKGKKDFELNVSSQGLRDQIFSIFSTPYSEPIYINSIPILIYTPTGTFCGWGGDGGNVVDGSSFCNGTNDKSCVGEGGKISCYEDSNCFFNELKKDLFKNSTGDAIPKIDDIGKILLFLDNINSNQKKQLGICLTHVKEFVETCHPGLEDVTKAEIDLLFSNECNEDDDDYEDYEDYEDYCGACNSANIGFMNEIRKDFVKDLKNNIKNDMIKNSKKGCCTNLKPKDGCDVNSDTGSFKSIDSADDYLTWWCRSNIDAFGHETRFTEVSGSDHGSWNFFMPHSLSSYLLSNIKVDQFNTGLAYNSEVYEFISDGYFDIFGMDKAPHSGIGKSGKFHENFELDSICVDRGDKSHRYFYSYYSEGAKQLKTDRGISEDALRGGLFFMLNTVDTGEYFFKDSIEKDNYVEKSRGYALSKSFKVENNEGKKLLCIGADTFNGKDFILGPGGIEHVLLDLNTEYTIFEPAYYPNLEGREGPFSHVSLFARNLEKSKIGTFKFIKPMESGRGESGDAVINPSPEYLNTVELELYKMNIKLEIPTNSEELDYEEFDVVQLIEGESLILKNLGSHEIIWYYGHDDLCENTFSNLLTYRYFATCDESYLSNPASGDGKLVYDNYINKPIEYSISPSDIIEYLDSITASSITKVTIPSKGEVEIKDLYVFSGSTSTEYLFYNPHTGRRFTVIVSNDEYVIDLDISSFNPSLVSVFDNENSKLCFKNYNDADMDLKIGGNWNSFSSGVEKCFEYNDFKDKTIIDPILDRELNVIMEDFSNQRGNSFVLSTIMGITNKVVANTPASYNPAYNYFELNPGASATPSVITTEIIDYKTILTYDSNVVNSIAEQIVAIVSISRIKVDTICDSFSCLEECGRICNYRCSLSNDYEDCADKCTGECDKICFVGSTTLPTGSICSASEEETNEGKEPSDPLENVFDIDCKNKSKFDNEEKCEETKQALIEKYNEVKEEITPYTVINEDKVITMLPILIKFDSSKTSLTTSEVNKIKKFIDEVKATVKIKCSDTRCGNEVINKDCLSSGGTFNIEDRYLDMIGFIILIDDPGKGKNCSFLENYLSGVMNISAHAALTDISTNKWGTPSMIIGFGVNRNPSSLSSCWNDLEFKKEIEDLYNYDFSILVEKGIVGVGHYCLRDGECKPITTGIQGRDYGLFKTESAGWSFKPITISPRPITYFDSLSPDEKKNCIKFNGNYYCHDSIKLGHIFNEDNKVIPSPGGLNTNYNRLTNSGSNYNYNPNFNMNSPYSSSPLYSSTGINLNTPPPSASNIVFDNDDDDGLGLGISPPSASNIVFDNDDDYKNTNVDLSLGVTQITFINGDNYIMDENNVYYDGDTGNILVEVDLLEGAVVKDLIGRVWFNKCGRYYYNGEGMTMIVYPEKEILPGQEGKSCSAGKVMEIYNQFNC